MQNFKELLTAISNIDDKEGSSTLLENLDLLEKASSKIYGLLLTTRMKKLMKEFGERDTDIYVVTYPKSGTTLVQMMLYQMTTDGNMDFRHLYDVSPWCRHSAFINRAMPAINGRRIIKTHDEYPLLKDIGKGKFIFVIRNCLDVISSFHEHMKDYINPDADFTELSNRKMKDWFDYNTTWVRNENKLDIMYVHYEDLLTDKTKVINEIAAFLGITLNDEIIDRTLDRTSFEFMKNNEAKFGEQPEQWKVYNNFIRKGKAGEGKNRFTAEQVALFENMLSEYGKDNKYILRYRD